MPDQSSRRQWIRNTTTMMAGIGFSPLLFATEKERYRSEGKILLNGNENAYGPSLTSRKAMMEVLDGTNRYPDDAVHELRQQLGDFWQIRPENILLGAGSSEFLGLVPLLVSAEKGNIITAEPSYSIWNRQAVAYGHTIKKIPLTNDRKLDTGAMLSAIDKDTKMFFICNPNNPTGTIIDESLLTDFILGCSEKGLVLVDEAYTEFAGINSRKELAVNNPNNHNCKNIFQDLWSCRRKDRICYRSPGYY